MGGSRSVARLAFMWGLISVGGVSSAAAQEAEKVPPAPRPQLFLVPPSVNSTSQFLNVQSPSSSTTQRSEARRTGPWLPQPWQSVRADTPNRDASLGDNHTIVISTLGLLIIGAVVLLLVL